MSTTTPTREERLRAAIAALIQGGDENAEARNVEGELLLSLVGAWLMTRFVPADREAAAQEFVGFLHRKITELEAVEAGAYVGPAAEPPSGPAH